MTWTILLGKSFKGNKISKELKIWYQSIEVKNEKM